MNRRSNTAGKPHVPGACGLVNVGNTCYLNSAVQCLSHTPLVRAYLLSDMWAAEVNKYNPLGTQVSELLRCLCLCCNFLAVCNFGRRREALRALFYPRFLWFRCCKRSRQHVR